MLSKIWNAIKDFFNLVATLVKFIIGLVEDLVDVVEMLADSIESLPGLLSVFFPTAFISSFMLIIAVVVIYKILGREG